MAPSGIPVLRHAQSLAQECCYVPKIKQNGNYDREREHDAKRQQSWGDPVTPAGHHLLCQ